MNFFRLIGELVLIYILYKVIFDFIIPVYRTTKQVKSKMNDMHSRMQEQQSGQSSQHSQEPVKKSTTVSKDDYIDYEEVK
jgi:Sec-independent protein translocase protein TatA